jgi:arsenical pump membrane protein
MDFWSAAHVSTWLIAALAVLGMIVRPWGFSEAFWAVFGAAVLVVFSLIHPVDAATAVARGTDVYCFLIGMMLLAEVARLEGLFDWLAVLAVRRAGGSAARLFLLVYGVGAIVTIFLSNDATAVVLTPAVYAAAKHADAKPLPYLYSCAFIANAASFVLPISNPANLVVFGAGMPSLGSWLRQFGAASAVSIALTYAVLRLLQRDSLCGRIAGAAPLGLSLGGRVAAAGISAAAVLLLIASSLDWRLGPPTLAAGTATALLVVWSGRLTPWRVMKGMSWSVLPLVAGLFVLVEAVQATGILAPVVHALRSHADVAPRVTALIAGGTAGLVSNLVNNLPLGLAAGSVATNAHLAPTMAGALLIGVDLGPNLSVTGSLATILWLVALRREGVEVGGWQFLKLGCVVMPVALIASLAAFIGLGF